MAAITDINQLDFSKTYSYADYMKWQFVERLELLKGKIFPMSAPSRMHQTYAWNINNQFSKVFASKKCKIFFAPFDVRLLNKQKSTPDKDIYTVVQPDLCVICDLSKLDKRGCIGSPDLIVEILSPGNSKTEMKNKFQLYQEAGVQEYWIVEPANETVLIYVQENGRFIGMPPLVNDDILISPTFPELQVNLAEVFEE